MVTKADYVEYFMHTQYHWIMGVRTLSHPCQPNLWEQINGLTEVDLTTIRQTQEKIKQKIWLVRAIYWLFNIHSYAEQYYQLLAYDELHSLLPDEERMPGISNYFSKKTRRELRHPRSQAPSPNPTQTESVTQTSSQEKEETSLVTTDIATPVPVLSAEQNTMTDRQAPSRWSWALSFFGVNPQTTAGEATSRRTSIGLLQRLVGNPIAPREQTSAPEVPSLVEDSSSLPQQHPTLTVQTSLLDSLALLALTKTVGETLSMAELKRAYYAQAVLFHPDKNPSPEAKEQFVLIANAYETLTSIIEGKHVTQVIYHNYADIWRRLDAMSQRVDRVHDAALALQAEADQLLAKTRAETTRLQAFEEQTARNLEERAHDIAETNQFIAELRARRSPSC